MKNKGLLLIALVLLLSNIMLLYLFFNKDKGGKRHGRDKMMENFVKEVGFTKEQATQFETLRKQQRENMKPMMDSMRILKTAYITALINRTDSDTLKKNYVDKLSNIMFSFDDSLYTQLMEARKICTPNQYAVYDSIVKKMLLRLPDEKGKKQKLNQ